MCAYYFKTSRALQSTWSILENMFESEPFFAYSTVYGEDFQYYTMIHPSMSYIGLLWEMPDLNSIPIQYVSVQWASVHSVQYNSNVYIYICTVPRAGPLQKCQVDRSKKILHHGRSVHFRFTECQPVKTSDLCIIVNCHTVRTCQSNTGRWGFFVSSLFLHFPTLTVL